MFGINKLGSLSLWQALISIITAPFILFVFVSYGIWGLFFKKWWIYKLFMLVNGLVQYLIYHYKKSYQIWRVVNFSRENIRFLLNPFSWRFYSDLSILDKKILKETSFDLTSLITKINDYFRVTQWYEWVKVSDYKVINSNKVFTLNRPHNLEKARIERIDDTDILNGIWLSIEKYNLVKRVANDIFLEITELTNNTVYLMKDYLHTFPKKHFIFWFDILWNEVKFPLDFSQANHLGVYGMTGGWKSNFTTSILYSLYSLNPSYRFVVLDIKWDFKHFSNMERVEYAKSVWDIHKLLGKVSADMTHINNVFAEKRVRNFTEYENLPSEQKDVDITPVFIFVEEFSILLDSIQNKQIKVDIINSVKQIALAWRSIAHTLIFSLQIPLKAIIWERQIVHMVKPLSFFIDNNMNRHIFWGTIDVDLSKLQIWEWVIKNTWYVKKFKALFIEKDDLDTLESKNTKTPISNKMKYFEHAKKIHSFSKKEALEFWLSRSDFDELSKELQEKWVLEKASNNSLLFK